MLLHILRAAVALTAEPVRGHKDGEAEVALAARQQSHTEAESSKAEAHSGAKACPELVPRAVCWTCRAEPHIICPSGWHIHTFFTGLQYPATLARSMAKHE